MLRLEHDESVENNHRNPFGNPDAGGDVRGTIGPSRASRGRVSRSSHQQEIHRSDGTVDKHVVHEGPPCHLYPL